ncbi:hypothetical protein GLYMA_04G174533v4 [Glycine max]|nr:hypothetical protein GLYMA_04G174533v4 [Glycine max]KAH1111830.1 hypothetical protein GYH30_010262 [Glycine max]
MISRPIMTTFSGKRLSSKLRWQGSLRRCLEERKMRGTWNRLKPTDCRSHCRSLWLIQPQRVKGPKCLLGLVNRRTLIQPRVTYLIHQKAHIALMESTLHF